MNRNIASFVRFVTIDIFRDIWIYLCLSILCLCLCLCPILGILWRPLLLVLFLHIHFIIQLLCCYTIIQHTGKCAQCHPFALWAHLFVSNMCTKQQHPILPSWQKEDQQLSSCILLVLSLRSVCYIFHFLLLDVCFRWFSCVAPGASYRYIWRSAYICVDAPASSSYVAIYIYVSRYTDGRWPAGPYMIWCDLFIICN